MLSAVMVAVITVALTTGMIVENSYAEEDSIPVWIKGVFSYYVNDEITDAELIDALEFLANNGILDIQEKQYEPFSKENFPETGGFNPDWLEGDHDKILKNCQEASAMGYENPYCKYLQ